MTLRLGIGVTTRNRRDAVAVTLSRVLQHTKYPLARIAVADDGSDDGTMAMLRARNVCTIGGRTMGAAWNNNRVLFLLRQLFRCDVVILLSDDVFPISDGWEAAWMQAAVRWGQAGLAAGWLRETFISGSGTLDDPIRSPRTSWACQAYGREALVFGGYFDTRCQDQGAAHIEYASRLARLGYGGGEEVTPDGSRRAIFNLLHSPMEVAAARAVGEATAAVPIPLESLLGDHAYRAPWRDETEMQQFRAEVREVVQAQGDLARNQEKSQPVPAEAGARPGASPALPGLSQASPGPSQASPGASQASPGLSQASPGHTQASPEPPVQGAPRERTADTQPAGSDLYQMFLNGAGRTRQMHRWHHYFPIFERVLGPFRGKPVTLVEIGVYRGGSLQMWRNWLGPQARLVGIDTDPKCAAFASDGTQVFIGDQANPEFLRSVLAEIGELDVVIDDGGHTATQQITSFEVLYPALRCPGVYLVEDTHTAFWGGQYDDRYDGISFVDYAFDRCRSLHEWTMRRDAFQRYGTPPEQRQGYQRPVSEFCRRTGAISFYDSIVVFERAERSEPWHEHR